VEFGQIRAYLRRLSAVDPAHLRQTYAGLAQDVRATLGRPLADLDLTHYAAMRYVGQAFELQIPVPSAAPGTEEIAALRGAFAQEHERTYGHRSDNDADVEVVAVQVVGTLRGGSGDRHGIALRRRRALVRTERECYFGPGSGAHRTPVIDRTGLGAAPLDGPLVIEEYEGTTVVPPGASAALDAHGNIVIATNVGDQA